MTKRKLVPHPDNPLWMLVPLGGKDGGFAVVHVQDAEEVGRHNWFARRARNNRYPYALTNITTDEGKHTTLQLHRLIGRLAGFDPAFDVDHENHDGLDCRRSNLRPATELENARNARVSRRNTTGFKGVSWNAREAKFYAGIRFDGRTRHLGTFDDPSAAAHAYDRAAVQHFGPFAFLNFPAANDNGLPVAACN